MLMNIHALENWSVIEVGREISSLKMEIRLTFKFHHNRKHCDNRKSNHEACPIKSCYKTWPVWMVERASRDLLFLLKRSTMENNFNRCPSPLVKRMKIHISTNIKRCSAVFHILSISSFVLLAVFNFHAMNFLSVAFKPVRNRTLSPTSDT